MNGTSRPSAVRRHRLALATAIFMVGTLLQGIAAPTVAADPSKGRPDLPHADRVVAGKSLKKVKPRAVEKGPKSPKKAPKADWPDAGSAQVDIPAPAPVRHAPPKPVQAGSSPIAIGLPENVQTGHPSARARALQKTATGGVQVKVASQKTAHKAGVHGLLFSLGRESGKKSTGRDGKVSVHLDYSRFAHAYGGDYASRLELVELPPCAVTTPGKKHCLQPKPLATQNNVEDQQLTSNTITLRSGTPTLLAAVASSSGAKGDYSATKLSPSATWNTNLNTGDFTWSYGISTPPVTGGFAPNIGLSYSSGRIDGRTGGTNNQSSWVGDGFDLWPGYIERRYKACADDGVEGDLGQKPGDECWGYDNAFISFNGHAGELVPAGDDEWKLKQDDGTRITHLSSDTRHNGDDNGEYWRLTTPDGTRYYFGYHRLPGWSSGDETTDSTWTVPVFGDDGGEPCHGATFDDSWCTQAWRWNLDYAVDTHGNAIAYYYNQEKNSYGRSQEATDDTRYVRGGYLDRIEYGLRSSAVYDAKPLAKVDFDSSERCLPNANTDCSSISSDSSYWYDTPWDLNCDDGEDCDQGRFAPSFWTRKRLTSITTQVLDGDSYHDVDNWKLIHRWGMADTDYQLLLDSIQHTGKSTGSAITLPKTTFAYTQLANRLDKTGDGYAPFIKARLSSVADETGGQIDVNYSAPACDWNSLPAPESNTTRCFPQYIGGSYTDDREQQWFNKYVVDSVTATDRTGGAPDQVTTYQYLGGAAWHYDDADGLTKEKFKTWSQWRGYGHVRVEAGGQGGESAMKSQSDAYFLRGMDGDRASDSGGTKDIAISLGEGEGDPITDHESAAGFAYKTVTYSGPDGKILTKTVNHPWHHQTAKKVRDWGTVTANFTGTSHSKTWTSLDQGAGQNWRIISASTTHDTVAGRVTQVDDYGDNATSADNRCTRTTYATNTTDNILTLRSRVETVAAGCDDTTVDRSKQVISDVRTAYDGKDYGATPAHGDLTATAVLKKHDGTTGTYLESGATYDEYGRMLTATDLTANVTATITGAPSSTARSDGRTSTVDYTPATGYPDTITKTTPPADPDDPTTAQTTTTTMGAERGLPTQITDTNGNTTKFQYDALGRRSKIWLADRSTTSTSLPNYQFNYQVEEGKPVAVGTRTLSLGGGHQVTGWVLFDGFMRQRQTQSRGPDGGRLLTDVFYDERGLPTKEFADYYAEGDPSPVLFQPDNALSVETQNWNTYDGLGRVTESRVVAGNGDGAADLGTTKTIYGGDRVTVIPPEGGNATTTLVDARGQTTELREHHDRTAGSAYDTITYSHTARGNLAKVTGPAGNTWSYTYNQLGQQTKIDDPDHGITTNSYNDRGQLVSTTDARGTTLVSIYDGLGRQTQLREDTATGTLRASWKYDTVRGAKGQPAESTRYVDGNAYTSRVTMYDRLYRPVRTATVIPSSEGPLAGTYQTGIAYKPAGVIGGVSYSSAGSLPGGSYSIHYDEDTLRPTAMLGDGFNTTTTYSYTGKPLQYAFSNNDGGKKTWATNTYEWGTRRLATSRIDREDITGVDRHSTYHYDQLGNVLSVSDVSRSGTDNQCFAYDYLQRLTRAWTEGDQTCGADPDAQAIGGPAPYWNSFSYDKAGNRLTQVEHDPTGDTTKDYTSTYAYPDPGSPQPHALASVTESGPKGRSQNTFQYDKTGNTSTRTIGGDAQTLNWNAEGHLAKVTQPTDGGDQETDYVYDADGNRLIARTPAETILYLGNTEVRLAKGASSTTATRYIDLGGGHQAVQEDDGTVSFTLADHQGTGQFAVSSDSQTIQQRRTLPFGDIRGQEPADWPGSKTFVGGTLDKSTGLTHLGAREYDPATGRFVSVDPLIDLTDPQQMQGYSYAGNSPVTRSDPSGLMACATPVECGGGAQYGNNTPTKHSHGKPLNDESWGCNGCDNDSYNHGWLSISGWEAELTKVVSSGQTMMDAKGSLVACAVGRCYAYGDVGNSVVDQQVGNFLYGMLTAGAMLVDLTSGLYTPACVVEGKCLSKKVKKWGAERGYDDGSTAAALGAAIVTGGRRGGRGEMPRPRELPEGHTSSPALKGGKLSGLCNSFVSGTEVLLADGTSKPIEDLKIGDKVLATDPKTGKTKAEEVTAEILGKGEKHLVKITVDLDGQKGTKSATVTATDGHPFWVAELKQWIDATQLHEGDWLSTSTSAGTRVQVTAVERWTQRATVYNLTVTDLHTYYVLAGATPVLVHNDDDGFSGTVFRDGAYRFQIYSNDHGPAHGHLIGPGIKGDGIQIGQNGKPLNPNVELSRAQQQVIDNNLGDIRSAIRKSMAAYRLNQQGGCK